MNEYEKLSCCVAGSATGSSSEHFPHESFQCRSFSPHSRALPAETFSLSDDESMKTVLVSFVKCPMENVDVFRRIGSKTFSCFSSFFI